MGKSQAYQLYATQGLLHFQANTANPVSVPLCCCISVNRMEHIRLQVQKKKKMQIIFQVNGANTNYL